MTLPKQTITVLDPGVGMVEPAADSPFYVGPSSTSGSISALFSFSDIQSVRTALGYGEVAEDVMKAISERGGPVLAMRSAGSIAGTNSVITKSGGGPTITVAGNPSDNYTVRLTIKKGGALGVGEFTFALDRHAPLIFDPTTSTQRIIPAGGTFIIPNTGLTLTFPAGTYVLDETYDFTSTQSRCNSADLGAVSTAIQALPSVLFPLWIVSGTYATATEGMTVASALGGHLTTLASNFRYARGIIDVGSSDTSANILTNESSLSDKRIVGTYGVHYVNSAAPFEGFSVRKTGPTASIAARAARELISTDLARYASGSLGGVKGIVFDGRTDETLDNVRISTLRTWAGTAGFYVANARLKSPAGSDFIKLQYGRIMDRACRTVYEAALPYIAEGFRTNANGTIFEGDAQDIESKVNSALIEQLLNPSNARGVPGHVSALKFVVDRTTNLNTTSTLRTRTAIRPLGYADFIVQDVGFTLNV